MKKIMIAGASVYGLHNMSDDVMLSAFLEALHREAAEPLDIVFLLRHPGVDFDRNFGGTSIKNLEWDSKEQSMGRWFRGFNPGDPTAHLGTILRELRQSSLLLIGGDPFIDITAGVFRGLAAYTTTLLTLARFTGTPVMLNGIHLCRPIKTDLVKEMMRFCLNTAEAVTVRENTTLDLLRDMGITVPQLRVAADMGWAADPVQGQEAGLRFLHAQGINPACGPLIGVTLRFLYWVWGEAERARYRRMFQEMCDAIVEQLDVELLFIPHCTYDVDHPYEDDRKGHAEIVNGMKHADRAHCMTSTGGVNQFLSVFPLLDLLVGNRRHSVIFGSLHGVPSLSVGETWHVKPAMDELPPVSDLFIPYEDLSTAKLFSAVMRLWTNRQTVKTQVAGLLPTLKASARTNAHLAASLLNH